MTSPTSLYRPLLALDCQYSCCFRKFELQQRVHRQVSPAHLAGRWHCPSLWKSCWLSLAYPVLTTSWQSLQLRCVFHVSLGVKATHAYLCLFIQCFTPQVQPCHLIFFCLSPAVVTLNFLVSAGCITCRAWLQLSVSTLMAGQSLLVSFLSLHAC